MHLNLDLALLVFSITCITLVAITLGSKEVGKATLLIMKEAFGAYIEILKRLFK